MREKMAIQDYDDIIRVKESVEKTWMQFHHIHGIGIGYKTVNHQKTEEIAICVMTEKKLPENEVGAGELLPKRVEGFPVDVEETPRFHHMAENEERYRPCPGGAQIVVGDSAGTVGGLVRSTLAGDKATDIFALSCFHVLQPIAEKVYQSEWSLLHPFRFATTKRGAYFPNGDAAIALLDESGYADYGMVLGLNDTPFPLGPVRAPALGDQVKKYGRTTRLTQGVITLIAATITVAGNIFNNQFRVDPVGFPRFSAPGDSGSLVLSDDGANAVIGLHAGGNGTYSVAADINNVLADLHITF
jgi:hypothetical protein